MLACRSIKTGWVRVEDGLWKSGMIDGGGLDYLRWHDEGFTVIRPLFLIRLVLLSLACPGFLCSLLILLLYLLLLPSLLCPLRAFTFRRLALLLLLIFIYNLLLQSFLFIWQVHLQGTPSREKIHNASILDLTVHFLSALAVAETNQVGDQARMREVNDALSAHHCTFLEDSLLFVFVLSYNFLRGVAGLALDWEGQMELLVFGLFAALQWFRPLELLGLGLFLPLGLGLLDVEHFAIEGVVLEVVVQLRPLLGQAVQYFLVHLPFELVEFIESRFFVHRLELALEALHEDADLELLLELALDGRDFLAVVLGELVVDELPVLLDVLEEEALVAPGLHQLHPLHEADALLAHPPRNDLLAKAEPTLRASGSKWKMWSRDWASERM